MFGFGHRRHGHCPLSFLLALIGIKSLVRHHHMTDEEREDARSKAATFRTKLREAWAVWDEETPPEGPEGHA